MLLVHVSIRRNSELLNLVSDQNEIYHAKRVMQSCIDHDPPKACLIFCKLPAAKPDTARTPRAQESPFGYWPNQGFRYPIERKNEP
jgi:hypothetical protein